MFYSRTLNEKINKLQERALRVVCKNNDMTYQQLLEMENSYTIHERNLQKVATEMYKIKHNLSPKLMNDLFTLYEDPEDLRENKNFLIPKVRTVNYGLETIRYRGPLIWNLVPLEIKQSKSLVEFRHKIKAWKPIGCTCRLCKLFVKDVGFI